MNEELKALLAGYGPEKQQAALKLALEISVPIAYKNNAALGDGQFLLLLIELLKILLPLLLDLLED